MIRCDLGTMRLVPTIHRAVLTEPVYIPAVATAHDFQWQRWIYLVSQSPSHRCNGTLLLPSWPGSHRCHRCCGTLLSSWPGSHRCYRCCGARWNTVPLANIARNPCLVIGRSALSVSHWEGREGARRLRWLRVNILLAARAGGADLLSLTCYAALATALASSLLPLKKRFARESQDDLETAGAGSTR